MCFPLNSRAVSWHMSASDFTWKCCLSAFALSVYANCFGGFHVDCDCKHLCHTSLGLGGWLWHLWITGMVRLSDCFRSYYTEHNSFFALSYSFAAGLALVCWWRCWRVITPIHAHQYHSVDATLTEVDSSHLSNYMISTPLVGPYQSIVSMQV